MYCIMCTAFWWPASWTQTDPWPLWGPQDALYKLTIQYHPPKVIQLRPSSNCSQTIVKTWAAFYNNDKHWLDHVKGSPFLCLRLSHNVCPYLHPSISDHPCIFFTTSLRVTMVTHWCRSVSDQHSLDLARLTYTSSHHSSPPPNEKSDCHNALTCRCLHCSN